MNDPAIILRNLNKTFKARNNRSNPAQFLTKLITFSFKEKPCLKAIKNINLEIRKGEIFGIIGANGSGKSTLINLIMGNLKPDKGSMVKINGKMIRLTLGLGVDNNLTARENIYLNGSVIGLTLKEVSRRFNQIIEFAGIENFVDTPVKFYSKGMRNRLLFSIAIHANADIFLLDEFFGGVGDEEFKAKSDKVFDENIVKKNTIVLVSHSLSLIQKCNRVLWLDQGKCRMLDSPDNVVKAYKEFMRNRKNAKH